MTDRALQLLEGDRYRLATHLVDYALELEPEEVWSDEQIQSRGLQQRVE